MTKVIEKMTREQIAKFLPDAIQKTLESYQEFMAQPVDVCDDIKNDQTSKIFSEHHKACKAAISHLELLLKLAKWAHLPGEKDDEALAVMLSKAHKKVIENKEY